MNTQFKCAIFDLDGTLVNTIDDLGLATDYVLEQYGRTPKWTQADYKKLVGNGAKKLVERAFEHQLSPEQLEEAYAMFKVKYNAVKMDHAHAYPGIQAALDDLKTMAFAWALSPTNRRKLPGVWWSRSLAKTILMW